MANNWKGVVNVRCASCSFPEELSITLLGSDQIKEVEHTCPRCKAVSRIVVRRQDIKDVEEKE